MPLQQSLGMGWLQGHSLAEATPAPRQKSQLTHRGELKKRNLGVVQCSLLAGQQEHLQLFLKSCVLCPGQGWGEGAQAGLGAPAPAAAPGAHPEAGREGGMWAGSSRKSCLSPVGVTRGVPGVGGWAGDGSVLLGKTLDEGTGI